MKKGTIFIIIGILMVITATVFFVRNIIESNRAGEMSEMVVRELTTRISKHDEPKDYKGLEETATYGLDTSKKKKTATKQKSDLQSESNSDETAVQKSNTDEDMNVETWENIVGQMPTEEIDGNRYIGVIETNSFCLPVMDDWDYNKLKISPCRYAGSYLTDNLVICGHNYATHFSSIKWMHIGDDVYFTTVTGKQYHYIVSNMETIEPGHIAQMTNTGDWQLTLFTCHTGGMTRCAVRCTKETNH
jgi:sortase A